MRCGTSGVGTAFLLLAFVAAAAATWIAGACLSRSTDALDDRMRLGEAVGGTVIVRLRRRLARPGLDSIIVLVLYAVGIGGLFVVQT